MLRRKISTTRYINFDDEDVKPSAPSGLDVASLLNNEFLSDFKIKCANGNAIPAHKVVLALSSPVFNRMLQANFKESAECEIVITDFAYEVVMEMVRFMYTGKTAEINGMAMDLLKMAEKYELTRLKSRCEEIIIRTLSVTTVIDLFTFADTYNAVQLEAAAIQFIMSYFVTVRNTSGYKSLPQRLLFKLCDVAMG
ncbi:speckle-type POZ protein-like [Bradysia coprophila]|uniref:speckle-type POZ protein-like n=1 Tax=Bradysia coprophila TaxID=38358 RepID=UPI00187D9E21|nr:speckle-type POZ protein-like [Bradysia coprophila]